MRKMIIVLVFFLYCNGYEEPKPVYDYDFQNDIIIYNVGHALIWMSENTQYISDKKDYAQTPEETYNRRNEDGKMLGDCEDFAIFFGYLIYTKLEMKDIDIVAAVGHTFNYLGENYNTFFEPIGGIFQPDIKYFESFDIIEFISYPVVMGRILN